MAHGVGIHLAFRGPERRLKRAFELGDLDLLAIGEQSLEQGHLVGQHAGDLRRLSREQPVALALNLTDGQKAAHGEVDDGRRDVFGVGRLVEDQAQLCGPEFLRRLELDDHRLVLENGLRTVGCRVVRLVVPREIGAVAAVGEPEANDQSDSRDQKQQTDADRERVDVERVLRELALAGLEQRGRDTDRALRQRGDDRHLLPRAELARRRVCEEVVEAGDGAPFAGALRALIARGFSKRASRHRDACRNRLLGYRPQAAVDVPEKLVVIGERVHRAHDLVCDDITLRSADGDVRVADLDHLVVLDDRCRVWHGTRPVSHRLDRQVVVAVVRIVVAVAGGDGPKDAVLLQRAEVDAYVL